MSKGRVWAVASDNYEFAHENDGDIIWWVEDPIEKDGEFLFSFDRETVFNLFRDYPMKLTPEQKAIFDRENPYWKEFFIYREQGG